jgi:hypothetical protein
MELWHVAAAGVGAVFLLGGVYVACWAITKVGDWMRGR